MKLKDFIANRDFDVNAEYAVYNGVWDGRLMSLFIYLKIWKQNKVI